jgi:hypothetical protein
MDDAESQIWQRLFPQTRERIVDGMIRLRPRPVFELMWSLLTVSQRNQLGSNCEEAYQQHGAVAGWMKTHGLTNRFVAVVHLAHQLDLLWPRPQREAIAREIGLEGDAEESSVALRPHWDRKAGLLSLRGKPIRKVTIKSGGNLLVRILNAFEDQGWPASIETPRKDSDPQPVRSAVYQLNDLQSPPSIRFSTHNSGRFVSWKEV